MPKMTDPMDALLSFQPAFRAKELIVQKVAFDATIFVHMDKPLGEIRYTYVRTQGKKVTALVNITMAEAIEGVLCFAIGYAVPEEERRRGLATQLVKAAIAELQHGLARNGVTTFYIEAVGGKDNIASQKVAAATLTITPREGVDSISGNPVFVYGRKFSSTK